MSVVVVDVMPKPEILDAQGQAVADALTRLGVSGIAGVRQGKRFELQVDGPLDQTQRERIEQAAAQLLANPVIEQYEVHVSQDSLS